MHAGLLTGLKVTGGLVGVGAVGTAIGVVGTKIDRSNSEIDELTKEYLSLYDRDGKTGISMRPPASNTPGAIMADERVRGAKSLDSEPYTILPLLLRANERNLDGDRNTVSPEELRAEITSFDTNGDGDIERELFKKSVDQEPTRYKSAFQFDGSGRSYNTVHDVETNIRYRDILENYGPDQEVRHRFDTPPGK